MKESDLTDKQKRWLEASEKIGPGAMTRTERETLEKLYADMLPQEQQELARYIQEKFGKKNDDASIKDGDQSVPEDPISRMEQKQWATPSNAFVRSISKSAKLKTHDETE
jgi:hypothetical protein